MSKAASVCDGLKIDRCQNILIEGCLFAGGDDSCLIMNTYGDTRLERFYSVYETQPTKYIEISNCIFPSYFKGLGFCALGNACPDLSQVEISDIYIHDNKFCSVGIWSDHWGWLNSSTLAQTGEYIPMKNIIWENNDYEYWPGEYNYSNDSKSIQYGLQSYPVSNQISDDSRLHSMKKMINGDFDYAGIGYWIVDSENGSLMEIKEEENNKYGYLTNLEKGKIKVYEGIYVNYGKHTLTCKIKLEDGASLRLFIKKIDGTIINSIDITSSNGLEEFTLDINMPGNNLFGENCLIGVESINNSGSAIIDDFIFN